MKTITIGSLQYEAAGIISVPHAFTTRLGGVSTGHLSSMNIGMHRADAPENVLQNYQILADALGFTLEKCVLSRQIHSDIILQVGKEHHGAGLLRPDLTACDALITNEPDTALVVFTADCTPILLHDPITGAVGAIHAGWRGTAACIAAKTVAAMVDSYGCKPENIRAAIGPNIGPCCFQTDADVPNAMYAAFGKAAEPFIRYDREKYYVNLKELNALALQNAGIHIFTRSTACTACNPDLFWSHRRMGNQRGSQGAIIVCKEAGK